jgi:hypothetical protein
LILKYTRTEAGRKSKTHSGFWNLLNGRKKI